MAAAAAASAGMRERAMPAQRALASLLAPADTIGARLLAMGPARVGSLHERTTHKAVSLVEEGTDPEFVLRNADHPDEAYSVEGDVKYTFAFGSTVKWSTPISWYYNPSGQSTLFTQAEVINALQQATAQWAAVCNVRFSYAGTTSTKPSMSSCDGKAVVGWAPYSSSTVGVTHACYSGSSINDADIAIDNSLPYQITSLATLQAVAAHEFGHAIGLGHTSVNPAMMTASLSTSSLTTDDINGCRALYGASSTTSSPVASLSVTSLSFASQVVGTTSAAKTVRVTNTGGGSLTFSSLSVGGLNPSDFARAGTCTTSTSLASGQYCDISVSFRPLAAGSRSASLSVTTNAGSASVAGLAGTGASPVSLSPTSISFGSQTVGTTSTLYKITLTNKSTASLQISAISTTGTHSAEFLLGGGTCPSSGSLAAGASCTIGVKFSPVGSGTRSASVSITSNATGSPHAVSLSGSGVTGTGGPVATLNMASLNFGDVALGTKAYRWVRLTNTGSSVLTVSAYSVSGTSSADFWTTQCPPGTSIAPGAYCGILVWFRPGATGSRSATLSVTSNAPTVQLPLAGRGI